MQQERLEQRPDDDLDFGWLQIWLDRPLALPLFLFAVASLLLYWTLPQASEALSGEPIAIWGALGLLALCAGLVAALGARGLVRRPSLRWQRAILTFLSLLGLAAGVWAAARGGIDLLRRIGGLDVAFGAAFAASFATGLLLLELAWPENDAGSGRKTESAEDR